MYSHLLLYKEDLANRNRAETGIRYEWYALQRWGAKYWDDFSKQKIIYREISDAMNATLAEPDIFINNKCYMITGEHLIYLLSFINSALFTKIILQQANLTGGKGEAFLSLIRLVRPSAETEEEIIRLFNNRKGATPTETKAIDRKVDAIFCQLFGLTETETNYILS